MVQLLAKCHFDWDINRPKDDGQNILAHQEVKISKTWVINSTNNFVGKVNGETLAGKSLAIDPLLHKTEVYKKDNISGTNGFTKRKKKKRKDVCADHLLPSYT
ncbi:MAG: hypothetical protein ACRD8Z_17190 [Nitrososphaeraceae archaeon]